MTQMPMIAVVVGEEGPLRVDVARGLAALGFDSVLLDDTSAVNTCLGGAKPDIVLLTAGASRSESLGMVARAGEIFARHGTPVVMCAGRGDIATLGAAIIEGADECLVAPIDPDVLKYKLEQTGVLNAH